jgi:hypothetical protein
MTETSILLIVQQLLHNDHELLAGFDFPIDSPDTQRFLGNGRAASISGQYNSGRLEPR